MSDGAGPKLLAHITTPRMDKDEFQLALIAGDIHAALSDFVCHEGVRDQPEFDRLRALVNDNDKWLIRTLSGGS